MYRDECSAGIMRNEIKTVLAKKHTVSIVKTYEDRTIYIDCDDMYIMIYSNGKAESYDKRSHYMTVCDNRVFGDIYNQYIK